MTPTEMNQVKIIGCCLAVSGCDCYGGKLANTIIHCGNDEAVVTDSMEQSSF